MSDPRLWLIHISESIERIGEYLGSEPASFFQNSMVQDAVVRNLQVLAQSALNLPQEMQDRHSEINWRGIRSFRNIVVHQYLGLDLSITWAIVEQDLPLLAKAAQLELELLNVEPETRGS